VKLFTLGFTKKSAEEFFGRLKRSGASRLVDVRLNNVSQLAGFTKKDDLRFFTHAICGIPYLHLPTLAPTQAMLDGYKKAKGGWEAYEHQFLALMAERQVERAVSREQLAGACLLLREHARVSREGKLEPLVRIATFILDFECVHPFADGNGRLGRLLTLLLLYQAGYEVGRYISLERVVEESKESYYEALLKSSQGWHDGSHDLRPWWNYFLGMLTAAYKEFEERVGTITSARGAKREMVRAAIERMSGPFTIEELRRACPGVSYPTLQRALADLRRERKVRCLGRGPKARWERSRG